jgi:HAE1 family hydrophobic/amphiphilic exporter-1
MYRLPELVRLEGILVQPVQASNLLYVNLYSTDKNATEKFLFNYATVYLIPELKRIKGVGQAKILGARQFAMRVWLDPDRMRAYNITTSEVMKSIQAVAWEGLTYDEALRGNEAFYIFLVVLVFVYLVLSAQYESFIIPFTVIFSLPPGLFGSFFLLKLLGLANDVYAQIGLIMLVGLLGKNAVLIVEFARQKQAIVGLTVFEAAIEGAKARFRPILMTSFAFIAGLIPLLVSGGPVAVANRTIGACALGGMLFGTIFGVILVPGLYYIFGSLAEGKELYKQQEELPLSEDHIRDTNLMKHHEGEIHE